jgi:hypothetical protein
MIQFFQVVFLIASVIVLVLNVIQYNKYTESKKYPQARVYPISWFNFILTTIVALGCALNIIISWLGKG